MPFSPHFSSFFKNSLYKNDCKKQFLELASTNTHRSNGKYRELIHAKQYMSKIKTHQTLTHFPLKKKEEKQVSSTFEALLHQHDKRA